MVDEKNMPTAHLRNCLKDEAKAVLKGYARTANDYSTVIGVSVILSI